MITPSQIAVEAAKSLGLDPKRYSIKQASTVIQSAIDETVASRKAFIDEQDSHIVSLEQQIMQLREALAGSLKHSHEDGFCEHCTKAKEVLSASAPIAGKWLLVETVFAQFRGEHCTCACPVNDADCPSCRIKNGVPIKDVEPLLKHTSDHGACYGCATVYNDFISKHVDKLESA